MFRAHSSLVSLSHPPTLLSSPAVALFVFCAMHTFLSFQNNTVQRTCFLIISTRRGGGFFLFIYLFIKRKYFQLRITQNHLEIYLFVVIHFYSSSFLFIVICIVIHFSFLMTYRNGSFRDLIK